MSAIFTRAAAVKTARWSAVPAIAALALAVTAGPALAAGTSVGVSTTSGTVSAGELTVSGAYQCDPATSSYAELEVTASQAARHGRVADSATLRRVACTGSAERWQVTLSPRQAHEWFSVGDARVTARVWTPGDQNGQGVSSIVLWASAV